MSVWKRLTGRFRRADPPAPPIAPAPDAPGGSAKGDAETYLRDLIARPDRADGLEVGRAVQELRRAGRELVAIDLIHRLVALRPEDHALRALCAELLLARLDDVAAAPLLKVLADVPEHAARAAFLLAELHERAGDREAALTFYERVLARDVGYPNARERASRLRAELHPIEPGAATPTLFSPDGAMARGRYRLLRELGRGGAGTVYLALDTEIGRDVALKVYHPHQWNEGGPGRRFILEARTAAMLRHPGIIRIFDVEEALRAIVMERIGGGTVAALTKGGDGMTEARAIDLVRRVLEPLALVHRRGIVHRDLKPSNLLLREGGEVVVSDFGVALVPGDGAGETPGSPASEARWGGAPGSPASEARWGGAPGSPASEARWGGAEQVGTYGYMPPEVRKGARATPASDVYAVGVILSELCARAGDAGRDSSRIYVRLTAADPSARPADATEALKLVGGV